MKSTLVRIHNGLAWLIFAGSIIQFFLISLAVFGAADSQVHVTGGGILMLAALIMAIVSPIVRVSKWNVILSILVLLLLFPVQGLLAYIESLPGAVRALHGVNGVLILGLSYQLANGFAKAVAPVDTESEALSTASAAD